MAKQKRTVPLGQFKYGEISPQAAQSLSPKESPYSLRKARNMFVDLLSGARTRRGSEYMREIPQPADKAWGLDIILTEPSVQNLEGYGALCKYSNGYKLTGSRTAYDSIVGGDSGKYYLEKKTIDGYETVAGYRSNASPMLMSSSADIDGDMFAYLSFGVTDISVMCNEIVTEVVTALPTLLLSGLDETFISLYNRELTITRQGSNVLTIYEIVADAWTIKETITLPDGSGVENSFYSNRRAGNYISVIRGRRSAPETRVIVEVLHYEKTTEWALVDTYTGISGHTSKGLESSKDSTRSFTAASSEAKSIYDWVIAAGGSNGVAFTCKGAYGLIELTSITVRKTISTITAEIGITHSTNSYYHYSVKFNAIGGTSGVEFLPSGGYVTGRTVDSVVNAKIHYHLVYSVEWPSAEFNGPYYGGLSACTVTAMFFDPRWASHSINDLGLTAIGFGQSEDGKGVWSFRTLAGGVTEVGTGVGTNETDNEGAVVAVDKNALSVISINKQGNSTLYQFDTTWGSSLSSGRKIFADINSDGFFDDNIFAYGDVEGGELVLGTGAINHYIYKVPPLDISLMSLSHPFSEDSTVLMASSLGLEQVVGSPPITFKASIPGISCKFLDYTQWGNYVVFIDEDKTDIYIADISQATPILSLTDWLSDPTNLPFWEATSDVPSSLSFHEGRMLYVSKNNYYGSALSHFTVASGSPVGHPFSFPTSKITEDGEDVYTPSAAFEFSPLGGGDTGFRWVASGQMVFGGSKKSLWVLSGNNGSVSAKDPNMHKISSLGASDIKGIQTGAGLFYIQADNKTVIGVTLSQYGPASIPINAASRHFFEDSPPKEMLVTTGLDPVFWILREDGSVVSYQLNNENELNAEGAWALHNFNGTVLSIARHDTTTSSDLVIAIERTGLLGEVVTTVEKVTTEDIFLDSYQKYDGDPIDSIVIPRYKNREVMIQNPDGSIVVTADDTGLISFGETLTAFTIGLPYDSYISPRVFPDIHGKEKGRIVSIAPIVEKSKGFKYGEDLDDLKQVIISDGIDYTGQVENLNVNSSFEYLPGFVIKALPGSYLEINAIYVEVE